MVNYYEELGLDRTLELDELNRELSRVESTWKRRRTRAPEKAVKMLSLVVDAREVFASSGSRAAYDRKLDAWLAQDDERDGSTEGAYPPSFISWKEKAEAFHDQEKNDLALTALKKAITALGGQEADVDFNLLAAAIHKEVGDTSSAFEYVNEAIVLEPDDYRPLFLKAMVYEALRQKERDAGHYDEMVRAVEKQREILLEAVELARMTGDFTGQGTMLGAYAFSLYNYSPSDEDKAEALAKEALELGDYLTNAQRVIDAANETKREERKKRIEEELRRRREKANVKRAKAEQVKRQYYRSAERIGGFDVLALQIATFEDGMASDPEYFLSHHNELKQYLAAINKVAMHDPLSPVSANLRNRMEKYLGWS